jgi:anti-anti-sigma factor
MSGTNRHHLAPVPGWLRHDPDHHHRRNHESADRPRRPDPCRAPDIDAADVAALVARGRALIETGSGALVVALTDVTFLGSSGMGAFVHLRNRAIKRGQTVTARGASDAVARVFEITGLSEAFGM